VKFSFTTELWNGVSGTPVFFLGVVVAMKTANMGSCIAELHMGL
jgi:hypothetical protein